MILIPSTAKVRLLFVSSRQDVNNAHCAYLRKLFGDKTSTFKKNGCFRYFFEREPETNS